MQIRCLAVAALATIALVAGATMGCSPQPSTETAALEQPKETEQKKKDDKPKENEPKKNDDKPKENEPKKNDDKPKEAEVTIKAVANLIVTPQTKAKQELAKATIVSGTVTFTKAKNGTTTIEGEIHGLEPGKHGLHIHDSNDVTSPDGMGAGGHFNPTDMVHGDPNRKGSIHHLGDLGNVEADATGTAKFKFEDFQLPLDGPNKIIGRGLVIQAKPDDFGQPNGNAGDRLAVGSIDLVKGS